MVQRSPLPHAALPGPRLTGDSRHIWLYLNHPVANCPGMFPAFLPSALVSSPSLTSLPGLSSRVPSLTGQPQIHSPPLDPILSGPVLSMAQWWNPVLSKHWSWTENLPRQEGSQPRGFSSMPLAPGWLPPFLLWVAKTGSVPVSLKLCFRSHDNSCCQPFPKGFADIEEQKGNKYREHSKNKKTVYKDRVVNLMPSPGFQV